MREEHRAADIREARGKPGDCKASESQSKHQDDSQSEEVWPILNGQKVVVKYLYIRMTLIRTVTGTNE